MESAFGEQIYRRIGLDVDLQEARARKLAKIPPLGLARNVTVDMVKGPKLPNGDARKGKILAWDDINREAVIEDVETGQISYGQRPYYDLVPPRGMQHFKCSKGLRVKNRLHELAVYNTDTKNDCAVFCDRDTNCESFDFFTIPEAPNMRVAHSENCFLYSKPKEMMDMERMPRPTLRETDEDLMLELLAQRNPPWHAPHPDPAAEGRQQEKLYKLLQRERSEKVMAMYREESVRNKRRGEFIKEKYIDRIVDWMPETYANKRSIKQWLHGLAKSKRAIGVAEWEKTMNKMTTIPKPVVEKVDPAAAALLNVQRLIASMNGTPMPVPPPNPKAGFSPEGTKTIGRGGWAPKIELSPTAKRLWDNDALWEVGSP